MANLRIWILNLFVFGIIALFPIVSESSPSHINYHKKAKANAVSTKSDDFRVRGTNLGGWLLVEGWIKPSLFDGIPNKNFLDGTNLQFKSVTTKKNLCPVYVSGGGGFVEASCNDTCGLDQFRLWRLNATNFKLRAPKDYFVGLDGIEVVAVVVNSTEADTFEIIRESEDSNRVRIRGPNGFYLQAKTEKSVTADIAVVAGWDNSDPTVFNFTIVDVLGNSQIEGDFQLQNGHGSKAAQIMQEHYDTFINESDFQFMNDSGVNAVRIPVGWWTIYDPNPPFPFVSGTLNALDNAFEWAKKYGLKVILDLHAAPGSQNGVAHSTTRDGSLEWGKTYDTIEHTLKVIEFYANRYGQHESLYGIELLNEPLYPFVTLKSLEEYYRAAYNVVRQYNPTVYVIFSIRLSFVEADVPPLHELFPLANSLDDDKIVVDVHWYSLYYDIFTNLTPREHIDYIKYNRTQQMTDLLYNSGNASIYIGEWSCGWIVEKPSEADLREFAKAQIDVYDRATFGWSFWTWKNVDDNWSLKWLIENGYVNLRDKKKN
ncbi:putative glucan 1,3-beta-glucosidase A [Senna tora]|uniref:Putative glucan 1,3-beta-glucosidase A n=1 Tax=Senna tora TaxID=362788 RepID=A0A834T5R5_9FABA|nr:putative glucan 1,3-beta-glucosidase A [Senna tora]